jgi:hypothetical protein
VDFYICFLSNRTFANMDELTADYESGSLHPADVKPALAKAINEILQVIDLAVFNVILLSF